MGLLTSVNNLSYTLEEEKKAKKLEQLRKQKEQIRKEDLNRYKKELEIYIKQEFEKYFDIAGSSYIYEFYNKARKQEILNNYFETITEVDANGFYKIPFKSELTEHFYNKYTTLLNKCLKEQKQQEEYDTIMNYKEIQEQEEQQKEISDINIIAIFKLLGLIFLGVVCFPVLFILLIILAAIRYMK